MVLTLFDTLIKDAVEGLVLTLFDALIKDAVEGVVLTLFLYSYKGCC